MNVKSSYELYQWQNLNQTDCKFVYMWQKFVTWLIRIIGNLHTADCR